MHTTLQPKTNVRLVALWGVGAAFVTLAASPTPWLFLGVGVALGVCAGLIQLRALRESAPALIATQTMMEVRRVWKSSRCGRLYLYAFSLSMAVIVLLAYCLPDDEGAAVGMVTGYFAFAFARELITLRGTFELRRLAGEPQP